MPPAVSHRGALAAKARDHAARVYARDVKRCRQRLRRLRPSGLVLVAVLATGCVARMHVPDDAAHRADGARLADAAVAAHGGMAAWQAIGGVRMHLVTEGPLSVYPRDTDWLLDPLRNRGVMRWQEPGRTLEYRYDGHEAVIVENGRCVGSESHRREAAGRVSNILFWFGVPWKFRDQGAIVRATTPLPIHAGARPSPRFLVTYTVGDTPQDWFLVSLDPDSQRIARIEYVASAFSRAVVLDGRWERCETIDGLSLVTRRVHRPRGALLRALARPFVQTLSAIELHQPLADADFAAPKSCTEPPPPPPRTRVRIDVTAEVFIDRPPAEVARVLGDARRLSEWLGEDTAVAWEGEPTFTVGARFVFRTRFLGRTLTYPYEVIEFVPHDRLLLHTVEGAALDTTAQWREVSPGRTRLSVRTTGDLPAPALAAPLIPSTLRRETAASLRRLKALVEQR
jgi:hypothetical protein